VIFVQSSFVGLPLINQALAALHPLGGNSFFVTVRGLMQVVGSIPIADVVKAVAAAHAPHPPPPGPTPPGPAPGPPKPPQATCGAELDLANPGGQSSTNERIFGSGYVSPESVAVIEGGAVIATAPTNSLGQFSVSVGFLRAALPTAHTVHAQGMKSGRVSPNVSFTV